MLEIPSLDIELLILADWDYRKLSKSPCRYSKTAAGDDLVICAHNCKPHFEPLRWVKFDSDMYLPYADGNVHHYKVDNIETLPPTDIEEMITSETEDGSSMWDLTLFTCTPGGASRMAVRCVRVLDY
jgi:sortase A